MVTNSLSIGEHAGQKGVSVESVLRKWLVDILCMRKGGVRGVRVPCVVVRGRVRVSELCLLFAPQLPFSGFWELPVLERLNTHWLCNSTHTHLAQPTWGDVCKYQTVGGSRLSVHALSPAIMSRLRVRMYLYFCSIEFQKSVNPKHVRGAFKIYLTDFFR